MPRRLPYGFTGGRLTSIGYSTTPVTSQTYLYENTALPRRSPALSTRTAIVTSPGPTMRRAARFPASTPAAPDSTRITYNDTDGSRTVTNALGAQTVYKFTTATESAKGHEIDRLATATARRRHKITYEPTAIVASQTDWERQPDQLCQRRPWPARQHRGSCRHARRPAPPTFTLSSALSLPLRDRRARPDHYLHL